MLNLSNYRKLSTDECKKISFDILVDVANYCEKNSLRYYLACGTLLGSIRHKGYIPWDDDIDIMMPRPDYNRFINEYKSDKYEIIKPEVGMYFFVKVYDKNTINIFRKIDYKKFKPIGVDIDIFPLDGIVNDERIVNKLRQRSNFLEMLLSLAKQRIFNRKNPIKAINRIIPRIIGNRNIVKMIENNAQTYDYDSSDYVIRFKNTTNGFTGALPKEVYEIDRKEFEGRLFNVPKGYDKWLSAFYGKDYMKLPPEDKRVVHDRESYILIK